MEQKQMPPIIHSEKINRKSTYKNKFQQFQEQQNKQFLHGHISSPPMPQLQTISHGPTGPGSQQMQRIRSNAKKPYQQSAKKGSDYWQNEGQTPGYGSLDDHHNQLGDSIHGSFDASKAMALKTMGVPGLNQSPPRKQTPLYQQINTIQPKKGDYSYLSENQEGATQVSKFRQNQNAYAINLGQKQYNKKVKNLNEQMNGKMVKPGGKGYQKNFKEDLITFQQNQQLQKTLLKVSSNDSENTRFNNNSIDKLPRGQNTKVIRTNQTSSYQQSRLSKTVKKDNENAMLQTPEIQVLTPLKQGDVKYISKYSITKKVGTANQETRLKKQTQSKGNTSIFDTSTIDMSVKGPSRVGARNKGSINHGYSNEKYKSVYDNGEENFASREQASQLHPANNLGYVNYINGVPVSIQLNNTNDFISKAQEKSLLSDGGIIPNSAQQPNSWKQNMIRRNDMLNNNDVNKMHQRNEMEKQQFLPNIGQGGRAKKIKPNYYKNKRKQNYSNLYEGEYGHLIANKNGPQDTNNESIDLAIKKNFTASQAFSAKDGGVLQNMKSKQSVTKGSRDDIRGDLSPDTGRRAESMYVPKRHRKRSKKTPSKSPPRSSSRKRSKKTYKNTTAATATDVEYKTPKQKLRRDDQFAGSTSKMMTSNKGSRKLIGASSFSKSKKSKDQNIKERGFSPLESTTDNKKDYDKDEGGPLNLEIPASQRTGGTGTARDRKKGQSVQPKIKAKFREDTDGPLAIQDPSATEALGAPPKGRLRRNIKI